LMKQFIPENGLYVYFRYNNEKTIMVIANNNPISKELNLNRFSEILSGKSTGTEITTGKTFDLQAPVSITGKTVLVLDVH